MFWLLLTWGLSIIFKIKYYSNSKPLNECHDSDCIILIFFKLVDKDFLFICVLVFSAQCFWLLRKKRWILILSKALMPRWRISMFRETLGTFSQFLVVTGSAIESLYGSLSSILSIDRNTYTSRQLHFHFRVIDIIKKQNSTE